MSIQAVAWALEQTLGDAQAKLILISLCNSHNSNTGKCFPSHSTIAHEADCSKRTVIRKLKWLEEQGWIEIIPTFKGGQQVSNAYYISHISTPKNSEFEDEIVDEFGGDNLSNKGGDNLTGGDTGVTGGGDTVVTGIRKGTVRRNGNTPISPKSRFEEFWNTFSDKRGRDGAERVWNRKHLDNVADEVIAGAKAYVKSRGDDRKYWKQAQGWLNDGRWKDLSETTPSKGKGTYYPGVGYLECVN
jgi:DNA-binding transcriptional regulator YhcF (GntR family)